MLNYTFHWNQALKALPQMLDGALVTLQIALLSMVLGVAFALTLTAFRLSSSRILRGFATTWVEIARLYGGSEDNMAPVFTLLAKHLKKIGAIASSGSQQMTLFQQGEVDVFMASTNNVSRLKTLGVPCEFVHPASGSPAYHTCCVRPSTAPNSTIGVAASSCGTFQSVAAVRGMAFSSARTMGVALSTMSRHRVKDGRYFPMR